MQNSTFTIITFVLTIIVFLSFNTSTFAQTSSTTNIEEEEEHSRPEMTTASAIQMNFVRKPKAVSSSFTGFKIEIINSDIELASDHKIFNEFGKINLENINSNYSYTIGSFTSAKKAGDWANRILIERYPNFKIVEYEAGERKILLATN